MRVSLNGYVVPTDDQWLYDWFNIGSFSPATVRQALSENPDGEDLELEINSPGGSVFAGFEMYSLLREAKCPTVAIVQSLAGSAASTVMAGCLEVRMSPVAQVMIHLPSSYAEGNQNDMRREAKVLEQITQSILNGYEEKCAGKTSRDKLDRLMRAESWLTAQEAVELGLADSILGQKNEYHSPYVESIVNAAGAGIRAVTNAAGPMWDRASLLDRYERLVRDGAKPAEGHPVEAGENPVTVDNVGAATLGRPKPDESIEKRAAEGGGPYWRAEARLKLEKNRGLSIQYIADLFGIPISKLQNNSKIERSNAT